MAARPYLSGGQMDKKPQIIVLCEFTGGKSHEELFSELLRKLIEAKAKERHERTAQSQDCVKT
jgi:hypothetical protein